jgi:hypothetical protein
MQDWARQSMYKWADILAFLGKSSHRIASIAVKSDRPAAGAKRA